MDEKEFKDRTKSLTLDATRVEFLGLMKETNEILAMTVASIKTLRSRNPRS